MPYDEQLASRIRELVSAEDGVSEQRMFGGLAFLVGGNMAVAASGQGGLLVRVDPAQSDELVETTRAGRWRCAAARWPAGCGSIQPTSQPTTSSRPGSRRGVEFARSLPAKR